MISAAVGRGGETISHAQKVEAFWNAVKHAKPLSVGLNCSIGPDLMYPFLEELAGKADVASLCIPECWPAESPLRLDSIWKLRIWPDIWVILRAEDLLILPAAAAEIRPSTLRQLQKHLKVSLPAQSEQPLQHPTPRAEHDRS